MENMCQHELMEYIRSVNFAMIELAGYAAGKRLCIRCLSGLPQIIPKGGFPLRKEV